MFNWALIFGDPWGIVLIVLLLIMAALSAYAIGNEVMRWLKS